MAERVPGQFLEAGDLGSKEADPERGRERAARRTYVVGTASKGATARRALGSEQRLSVLCAMRIWKEFEADAALARTGVISESLAAWLRERLRAVAPGPVEVETNLGGLDEAGHPSPDFDWIGLVADEFPALQVRVTYRVPHTRQEAIAPYEVCIRRADSVRRGWIELRAPGRWAVLEE
jgi:hypothetical protein